MIAEASRLTFTHDPFDSAIVATARLKDLPLITKDQQVISARVVEVAW
jgi:PIN domain nuclease of toxin-antitoxin system